MTVRITRAATLSAQGITIADLEAFIEAAKGVGANGSTRVSLTHHRGDQRDPDYYTLSADAGATP